MPRICHAHFLLSHLIDFFPIYIHLVGALVAASGLLIAIFISMISWLGGGEEMKCCLPSSWFDIYIYIYIHFSSALFL